MTDPQQMIADAVEDAEEFELSVMDTRGQKPRLRIENWNPHHAVMALRDILSDAQGVFDRGVPVRLAHDAIHGGAMAQALTPELLGMIAHTVCRPYAVKQRDQTEADARLPRWLAVTYLDWRGEWKLPPLNGITSAPKE